MNKQLGFASIATLALLAACGRNEAVDTADSVGPNAATDTDNATNGYGADDTASPVAATTSSEDQDFVTKAALAGMTEIQTGEMAEARAQRPEVRSLAEKLVTDHTAAAAALKTAASEYTVPSLLDQAHQAKIDDINNSDTESFDRDYLDLQEEEHEQAVALFEDYSLNGADPELKAFAATTLPTLRTHLEGVREAREGFDVGDDAMGLGSGNADSNETPEGEDTTNDPNQ